MDNSHLTIYTLDYKILLEEIKIGSRNFGFLERDQYSYLLYEYNKSFIHHKLVDLSTFNPEKLVELQTIMEELILKYG